MTYALLGRLRAASYKGVKFLIKDSTITFGQKTVVHQYPNGNRTEVEYLGIAEDQFELEIILHGSSLIEKRNRLKKVLSDGEDGVLIHPYEGEIKCGVVGTPTLKENDQVLGVCTFVVTFQKSTPQAYPNISANTKPGILGSINSALTWVENSIEKITTDYGANKIAEATKMNEIADTFDTAMRLTYKFTDKTNQLNEDILDFKRKIATYVNAPSDLASAITSLFTTINFIAPSNREQLRVMQSFYSFGDDDREIVQSTMERIEKYNIYSTLNNAMLVNSLVLSYGAASQIEYGNQDELTEVRNIVEDQYEAIREQLSGDILEALDEVRKLTLEYFDNLNVAQVITVDTHLTSLALLSFKLYGTITRYNELYDLNYPFDPSFIVGEVKALNE